MYKEYGNSANVQVVELNQDRADTAGTSGGVPLADRSLDLTVAYARLLDADDPAVRDQAARDWCAWEDAIMSLELGYQPAARYEDPRFRVAFARIVTHYFSHQAWLADGILLSQAGRLAGIPGVLIQGRFDLGGPPLTAWELARAWPNSQLHLVAEGHTGGAAMTDARITATAHFAGV